MKPKVSVEQRMAAGELVKHYAGCYRLRLDDERFAQIRRVRATHFCPPLPAYEPDRRGQWWCVEIRRRDTGELLRYEGVWATCKMAVEEARSLGGPVRSFANDAVSP